MITLICLDESIVFEDCDVLRYYLYDVTDLGDVSREFIFEDESLTCHHKGFDNHTNDDMINYISDWLKNLGYCNFTFKFKGK